MIILIDLTVAGIDTGSFDLYSNADVYTTPFAQNITRQQLLDGYQATVDNSTTTIMLRSLNNVCPGDTFLPVGTTTSTTTLNAPNLYLCTLNDVTIGTQIWTACNLNVETYSDGVTQIPQATTVAEWQNYAQNGIGAWCYYDFNPTTGATYGKLYNGFAVVGIWNEASKLDINQRKQLAPTGYHIPSETECTTLFDYLGGESVAGGKLKETGTLHWISNIATNSSGFTALPGGHQIGEGSFDNIGLRGYWWTSTVRTSESLYSFWMSYSVNSVSRAFGFSQTGYSVRLIKD